ncbi:hypothetical protein Vau01_010080 [Virgisporangium aurantiacum]|uniref:Uncharacterized protein n=1 Tax=Virgisporangium aurantiacum TaxID=175570 RepID=A0A8J3YZC7_9ACTN|nr:hypothetical protein Vau01_010080 [Virgisporangium aurantiacum]
MRLGDAREHADRIGLHRTSAPLPHHPTYHDPVSDVGWTWDGSLHDRPPPNRDTKLRMGVADW